METCKCGALMEEIFYDDVNKRAFYWCNSCGRFLDCSIFQKTWKDPKVVEMIIQLSNIENK